MKKALLFCFGLLLLAAAQLRAAPANVNFTSERGTPFNLRFDGRAMTRGGARQVQLNQIAPGVHWVDFVIPVGYGRSVNYRTRVFLDSGLETSYVLLTRPGFAPELRKVAAIPLRGGYPVGPPRGGQGGYQGSNDDYYDDGDVHRSQPTDPGTGNSGTGYPRDNDNSSSYPNGTPNNGSYPSGSGNNSYPNGNGNGSYPNGNYPNGNNYPNSGAYPGGNPGYNRALSPQDVDGLVAAMHRQSFDKDRLPMARLALSETAIQAQDLARLMKELSFEDSRMELAKYGAARVTDRQNLYRISEGFSFSGSAREFQEYLAQQPQR